MSNINYTYRLHSAVLLSQNETLKSLGAVKLPLPIKYKENADISGVIHIGSDDGEHLCYPNVVKLSRWVETPEAEPYKDAVVDLIDDMKPFQCEQSYYLRALCNLAVKDGFKEIQHTAAGDVKITATEYALDWVKVQLEFVDSEFLPVFAYVVHNAQVYSYKKFLEGTVMSSWVTIIRKGNPETMSLIIEDNAEHLTANTVFGAEDEEWAYKTIFNYVFACKGLIFHDSTRLGIDYKLECSDDRIIISTANGYRLARIAHSAAFEQSYELWGLAVALLHHIEDTQDCLRNPKVVKKEYDEIQASVRDLMYEIVDSGIQFTIPETNRMVTYCDCTETYFVSDTSDNNVHTRVVSCHKDAWYFELDRELETEV